jgi:aminoglycoside 3-N-acetyltransferase
LHLKLDEELLGETDDAVIAPRRSRNLVSTTSGSRRVGTPTPILSRSVPDEKAIIDSATHAVTGEELDAQLRTLGLVDGDVVIVHSALSRLGWVAGGAQAVVEALLLAVGPAGTLVMPTHSGQLSDPAQWENPPIPQEWIEPVRGAMPAFHPRLTTTRQMGQIVDCFRMHADTIRSAHPLYSLAANGPAAHKLLDNHMLTPSMGEGSPLSRLYDLDAKVLLLGVGHANNTSLHLAEYRATWATKVDRDEGAPITIDGRRQWVTYRDLDTDADDFDRIGEAFAATGAEQRGPIGEGVGRLCSQRAVVDFAVAWIEANR